METNDKKPTPEPKPEEILKAKVKYHSDNFAFTGLNHLPYFLYPVVIEVMQEYANLFHKEKLREELKAFNNFVLKLEAEGKIPLIDACIEDFIKTKG